MKHSSGAPFLPMLAGNVLIGTALISTAIIIVFFAYIVKFSRTFADQQVDLIARELANDISLWVPSSTAREFVDNIKLGNDASQQQDDADARMAAAQRSTYISMAIGLVIVSLLSIPLFMYYPAEQLLITNAIIAVFVGVGIFAFLHLFVKDYFLVDPNDIRNIAITSFLLKLAKRA